jgi:hypothetical protein
MRIAAIALIGSFILMSGASPGWTASAGQTLSAGQTVVLSAQAAKKAAKKAKKEKVEYMKSAAPPEPKK